MAANTATSLGSLLEAASGIVRHLHWLTDEHGVKVDLHPRYGTPELDVHGIQPGLLDELAATYPDGEAHRDEDAILQWVEVTIAGFVVTFFRR